MANGATKLRMSEISKTFPGVRALDNVSFEANAGTELGLPASRLDGSDVVGFC